MYKMAFGIVNCAIALCVVSTMEPRRVTLAALRPTRNRRVISRRGPCPTIWGRRVILAVAQAVFLGPVRPPTSVIISNTMSEFLPKIALIRFGLDLVDCCVSRVGERLALLNKSF